MDPPCVLFRPLLLTELFILPSPLLFLNFLLANTLQPILLYLSLHALEVFGVAFLALEVSPVLFRVRIPVRILCCLPVRRLSTKLVGLLLLELVLLDVLEGLPDFHKFDSVAIRCIRMVDLCEPDELFFALLEAITRPAMQGRQSCVELDLRHVLLVEATIPCRELTNAVSEQLVP